MARAADFAGRGYQLIEQFADTAQTGGACPAPADRTFPRIASSIWSAGTPERSTAALTAAAPRSGADNAASPPRKRPTGVRALPLRMTGVFGSSLP